MHLLCCLVFLEAHNRCFPHPTYINSKANHLADNLYSLLSFLSKVPSTTPQPTPPCSTSSWSHRQIGPRSPGASSSTILSGRPSTIHT